MRVLITGGAGCIGSELAQSLIERGDFVSVLDNFSSGKFEHISYLTGSKRFALIEGDLLDFDVVLKACRGIDMVWHLAANPDIKFVDGDPTDKDLNQNVLGTYNVLESMRRQSVGRLTFASSSAVYGEAPLQPIPEDQAGRPISLYGASKLACEALISSFQHLFGMRCAILRLSNVVGPKSRKSGRTVLSDFVQKLRQNRSSLEILGDGLQKKSYMHVSECVEAMKFIAGRCEKPLVTYNVGPSDSVCVTRIADMVVQAMCLKNVEYKFSGTRCGWPGDVPEFTLDVSALRRIGWQTKYNSEQAIELALKSMCLQN